MLADLRKSIAARALPGGVTFKEQRNHLLSDGLWSLSWESLAWRPLENFCGLWSRLKTAAEEGGETRPWGSVDGDMVLHDSAQEA